ARSRRSRGTPRPSPSHSGRGRLGLLWAPTTSRRCSLAASSGAVEVGGDRPRVHFPFLGDGLESFGSALAVGDKLVDALVDGGADGGCPGHADLLVRRVVSQKPNAKGGCQGAPPVFVGRARTPLSKVPVCPHRDRHGSASGRVEE